MKVQVVVVVTTTSIKRIDLEQELVISLGSGLDLDLEPLQDLRPLRHLIQRSSHYLEGKGQLLPLLSLDLGLEPQQEMPWQ